MNKIEEELYAQAAYELATNTTVPGVMAKAFADSDGDEKKATARYITFRVEHLKDEISRELAKKQTEEANRRQFESLKAWRKSAMGKVDWLIQVTAAGLCFVESGTQESITVSPKNLDYTIEFHPYALFHKIILTNKSGERFSFNAVSGTVIAAAAWWKSKL